MTENKAKIKVYFDEDWDGCTYSLRLKKREKDPIFQQEEKGFYIPEDKLKWIKRAEDEYFKAQQYISMKLRENDLI